jgi:hypothetical protein
MEKMLPVEWEDSPRGVNARGDSAVADKPIQLRLTPAGQRSLMMRLSDGQSESNMAWAKLPPIYWTADVTRAKPAAEVLAVNPDPARKSRDQFEPVFAVQQYQLGQVLFMGTDNTWRWRKNVGDDYYVHLWGQVIYRTSLAHLLGGGKKTQLSADKQSYVAGTEKVTIYARLYTDMFAPVTDPTVKGHYKLAGGNSQDVQLKALPEQPGLYRSEFLAPAPGSYQFSVERDPQATLDFTTTEPKLELAETAMNEATLRELAKSSGGQFFREEDLYKLPEVLGQRTEHVRSTQETDLWSSPAFFAMLILFAAAEWIMRKLVGLK